MHDVPPDKFVSVRLKMDQARRHINNLEKQINEFWSRHAYQIETLGDPKNSKGSYRIKGDPAPVPDSLTLTAGDAAHNMRSALDHFACAVVDPITTNAFPIWRTQRTPNYDEWRSLVTRKLKGASPPPPPLTEEVVSLRAYRGGAGEEIWAIDELDRVDKHRLLLAVAGAHTALILDVGELMRTAFPEHQIPSMPIALTPKWTPVKKGTELFTVQDEKGFKTEPKFTFDVVFAEPDVHHGEPVVKVLHRIADETENLLNRLLPLA